MWSPNDKVWSQKWENEESFGIATVLHLKRWLTHSDDFHFQFCPFIISDLALFLVTYFA